MNPIHSLGGVFSSWRFRISWIAGAALLAAILTTVVFHLISRLSDSPRLPFLLSFWLAVLFGVAIHGWVVWRGTWVFDEPFYEFGRMAISVALSLALFGCGGYFVFNKVALGSWWPDALLVFLWLFLHSLPAKLINVLAHRAFWKRENPAFFCPDCDCLMMSDVAPSGFVENVDYRSGQGTRTQLFGSMHRCLVCGHLGH